VNWNGVLATAQIRNASQHFEGLFLETEALRRQAPSTPEFEEKPIARSSSLRVLRRQGAAKHKRR